MKLIIKLNLFIIKFTYFSGDINDRIESQDELHQILQKCFKDDKELITQERFLKLIEDVHSEIFLFVILNSNNELLTI